MIKRIFKIFTVLFLVFLTLLLVMLLFSQTPTCKSWVKGIIVAQVNQAIHCQVTIEKLAGDLFTHLSLSGMLLSCQQDTLLYIRELEVRYAPLKFLKNDIYIEKLSLADAQIYLSQAPDSSWNFTHLIKKDSMATGTAEESSEEFPFTVSLENFQMTSGLLHIQTFNELFPRKIVIQNLEFSGKFLPENIDFELRQCQLQSLSPDIIIDNLTFRFVQNENQYSLKNLFLKTAQNEVSITGKSSRIPPDSASVVLETSPLHWDEFEFLLPDLTFNLQPRIRITTSYRADSLNMLCSIRDAMQEATLELSLGHVRSFLYERSDSLQYRSRLTLKDIDVSAIYPAFPVKMRLNGSFDLKGHGISKENARLDFVGHLSNTMIGGRSVSRLGFAGNYERGNAYINLNLSGEGGDAQIFARLQNLLKTPNYSLLASVVGLNYAGLIPGDSIETNLNATLKAEGNGFDLENIRAGFQLSISPSILDTRRRQRTENALFPMTVAARPPGLEGHTAARTVV